MGKKTKLKDRTITTEEGYKCSINVQFNVRNYQKVPEISKKDKDIIRETVNRKRRMQSNELNAELEVVSFMKHFGVDEFKEGYTRYDLVRLAEQMAPSTRVGISIFKLNYFTMKLEHVITPIVGLKQYINIVEVDYNKYRLFDSDRQLEMRYFCHECGKSERGRAYHRCDATCRNCNRSNTDCDIGAARIYCKDCHIIFFTQDCYLSHKKVHGLGSRCTAVRKCEECNRTYQSCKPHKCDEVGNWCKKCEKKHTKTQQWCSWQPMSKQKRCKKLQQQKEYRFAVYDIEAVQGEMYKDDEGKIKTRKQNHYANVIVVRMWCWLCEDKDRMAPCTVCGDRERVFRYKDASDDPHKFILNDPVNKERTYWAHNAARYDAQMVLQSMIRKKVYPNLIMDGFSVIYMGVDNREYSVYFKDSYKLIPCPVADMPNNFKLATGSKGTFPYLYASLHLNRPENYGTVTSGLPHDDYFGVLNEKKKRELDEFRASLPEGYQYDFDEEIVKYCRQDVIVVQEAMMAVRKEVLEVTGWCPFSLSNTIASYVLSVLVNNYAECEKMIYLPETGLARKGVNQSEKGMKWLLWKEKELGRPIQSVLRQGEYRIPGTKYHVDGYVVLEDGRKIVLEYLGCYWHGCHCMGEEFKNVHLDKKMRDLNADSEHRLEHIRSLGYEVVTVRECEIDQMLKKDSEMGAFFKKINVDHLTPLTPRPGVQGGRTENFRFRVVPGPNECIRYLDVVSLYPYVMYDFEYPLGTPVTIHDFTGIDVNAPIPWKGLIKAKILPPQDLLLPVLGYRCNDMLQFPLCRKCCEEQNLSEECTHSPEERALIGTYTHAELLKAQSKGYRILEYYEVWLWTEWTKNMYKPFINIFLKMKVEASGWPPGVEGDKQKMAEFLERYAKMGIQIDPANVRKSPGKRYCAKLMLNTLWGKMCQRDDLKTSSYGSSEDVWEKIDEEGYKISQYEYIDDQTMFTTWKPVYEMRHSSRYAALHHAAYVTSYGRLRLYDIMDKVKEGLIYCDTDSVMFISPKDSNPLESELGDFLGFLSDEIPSDEVVTAVTATAPKAYAVMKKKKTDGSSTRPIFKIKGVQQNNDTATVINFDLYNRLAESRVRTALAGDDESEFTVSVDQSTIKRRRTLDLETVHYKKKISAKSKKGAIRGTNAFDARRVPYGYLGPW